MKWTYYPLRRAFENRGNSDMKGRIRRGAKISDAPGPGAVWTMPEDAPGTFAYVRTWRGHAYEIEGEEP